MLVILKIPVVYLCAVVWWAIKAEPRPLEGAGRLASLRPVSLGPDSCAWRRSRGRGAPYRPFPQGGPRGGRSDGARRLAQAR